MAVRLSKAIPVTGRGSHRVVSLTLRPSFTPSRIPGTHLDGDVVRVETRSRVYVICKSCVKPCVSKGARGSVVG
jgi:hypothetical protein